LAEIEWARRQDLAECLDLLASACEDTGSQEKSFIFQEQAAAMWQRPAR
jgi:hypothetical protein